MATLNRSFIQNKPKNLFSSILLHFSRIIVGAVFIFSGFVKAIDPLGSTYKIEEYLTSFGGFFANFIPLAFLAGIALSTIELVMGLNLLFSFKLKFSAWITLLFMLFYTPLTFYIWQTNPVTDCGCFGDALVISNLATFLKNVVLLALVIIILITLKGRKSLFLPRIEWVAVTLFVCIGVGLSLYTYNHLPFIDFRPYKVGVNIAQAMELPEDAVMDIYETSFIYEKDGVQQEFTLENYPAGDSTWAFVDQKTKLIQKGDVPKIHDFSVINEDGDDITSDVLEYEGYTYFLIMYDLNKTSTKGIARAAKVYEKYRNT
ncbi:MAG: DoxX family protein, partial [Paludibacter sp.]|nr:DoxX family protein [Paludibacter sp.]